MNFKIGDDDLQLYDFISQFHIDLLTGNYAGVTRVKGTDPIQTAYRLDNEADLTLPTR